MKSIGLLTCIFVAMFFSSCAFGTRHVTLAYPPNNYSPGYVSPAMAAKLQPTKKRMILITFIDRRSDQSVIGEVRNGYGMHTADVVATNDVTMWISNAVKSELEAVGYTILVPDSVPVKSSCPALTGEILTVYCRAFESYEGEVSFIARVQKDGKVVLDKRYTGQGSAGLNWAMTSKGYGQSLSLALSKAVNQLRYDLDTIAWPTP
jgi:hypothetical protein